MPNQLPPELLALLHGQLGNTGSYMSGDMQYMPTYGQGSFSGGQDGTWQDGALTGYRATHNLGGKEQPNAYNGASYDSYDPQGNYTGSDKWKGLEGTQDMLPLLMMLAPLAMQFAGVGAGAGAGGAAGGGAGAGAAAAGAAGGIGTMPYLPLMEGMGGSMLPEFASTIGAGMGGVGTMPYLSTMEGLSGGALPEFTSTLGAGAGGAGGAGAAGAGAGGGGSGQALSKAALDGTNSFGANSVPGAFDMANAPGVGFDVGSLLKYAAPIVGAVAGSQGVKNETTQQNKMDPRMDPFIYGDANNQGLLQMARAQMLKDQSPERQAGYEQMRTQGMGLLSRPVAPNGFDRFFPGR